MQDADINMPPCYVIRQFIASHSVSQPNLSRCVTVNRAQLSCAVTGAVISVLQAAWINGCTFAAMLLVIVLAHFCPRMSQARPIPTSERQGRARIDPSRCEIFTGSAAQGWAPTPPIATAWPPETFPRGPRLRRAGPGSAPGPGAAQRAAGLAQARCARDWP